MPKRRQPTATAKATLPAPPESDVLAAVLTLLDLLGVPCWRANAGGGYRIGRAGKPQLIKAAPAGTADICGWLPRDGRFLAIEVKRPGERPTADQLAFLRRVNGDGGVGFWVDDVGKCQYLMTKVMQSDRSCGIVIDEKGSCALQQLWKVI